MVFLEVVTVKYDIVDFLESKNIHLAIEGSLDENDSSYDLEGIEINYPILYQIDLFKVDEDLEVELRVNYSLSTECSRCLAPMDKSIDSTTNLRITEGPIDEEEEESEEILQVDRLNEFPLSNLVVSQVITSIPSKFLCKEDCKGLCPNCGKDLNYGDCDCEEVDSFNQFAVLKDLFKDEENKEV